MPDRLMTIFSLGGAMLARHLRPRAVRCCPGFIVPGGPPRVVLDPFPRAGAKGVVEDGRAVLLEGDAEVGSRPLDGAAAGAGRWDDLDLLAFAATTLWTWIGLPLALGHPGVEVRKEGAGRLAVTVPDAWPVTARHHVLHLDAEGRVVRHEEGAVVHELSGHCDFGGLVVATRRRSRGRYRVPLLWADVVAAALLPGRPNESLN